MIENAGFIAGEGGIRLDAALLMRFPSSARSLVRDSCDSGQVLVNGTPAQKGRKLRAGDEVSVLRLAETADIRPAADPSVRPECVFEDGSILAFDKPAGMPVQPLDRFEKGTLMNGVVARWPECVRAGDNPLMAGALHRIDADTSGLVIVARSEEAFANLRAQFSAQTVEKRYLALVEGMVAVGGTLENDLAHTPDSQCCIMTDIRRISKPGAAGRLKPLRAVTSYSPAGFTHRGREEFTLLEISIRTGVTHQIRAQLALAGMHIVNDTLYGARPAAGMCGHRLHALSASFLHPANGERCEISTRRPAWAADLLF